jgi:hypothetical protein
MDATQVTAKMERLVPGKGKWVVEEVHNNTFKTTFPSRTELQRMIEWGTVRTKDRKAAMVIEEGDGSIKFKQAMRKIWMQMTGLPSELKDFPTIWVIGTILGVTKDVDMGFTRSFDRASYRCSFLILN